MGEAGVGPMRLEASRDPRDARVERALDRVEALEVPLGPSIGLRSELLQEPPREPPLSPRPEPPPGRGRPRQGPKLVLPRPGMLTSSRRISLKR